MRDEAMTKHEKKRLPVAKCGDGIAIDAVETAVCLSVRPGYDELVVYSWNGRYESRADDCLYLFGGGKAELPEPPEGFYVLVHLKGYRDAGFNVAKCIESQVHAHLRNQHMPPGGPPGPVNSYPKHDAT
jgi:hypothetical protein